MEKTNHEKYKSADELLHALNKIPFGSDVHLTEEMHAIGSRCAWCQANLNTWLLVHIAKMLNKLTK